MQGSLVPPQHLRQQEASAFPSGTESGLLDENAWMGAPPSPSGTCAMLPASAHLASIPSRGCFEQQWQGQGEKFPCDPLHPNETQEPPATAWTLFTVFCQGAKRCSQKFSHSSFSSFQAYQNLRSVSVGKMWHFIFFYFYFLAVKNVAFIFFKIY